MTSMFLLIGILFNNLSTFTAKEAVLFSFPKSIEVLEFVDFYLFGKSAY